VKEKRKKYKQITGSQPKHLSQRDKRIFRINKEQKQESESRANEQVGE